MKKITMILLTAVTALSLAACAGGSEPTENDDTSESPQSGTITSQETESISAHSASEESTENKEDNMNHTTADMENLSPTNLQMKIGDTAVSVEWEDNASVEALAELVKEEPLAIPMSMYGGFEQVGPLGTDLTRNDVQTTTQAGDIVLYAGNQIVVFYGSNDWAYTRLGHITDKTADEMAELLGHGDVTIRFATE